MYIVDYNKLLEPFFEVSKPTKTSYKETAKRLAIDITDDTLQIGLVVTGHSA